MTWRFACWLLGLAVLLGSPAAAHVTATGLAAVSVEGDRVEYRLTLVLADLPVPPAERLFIAAGGDRAAAEEVAGWLRQHVAISGDEAACRPGRVTVQGSAMGDDRVVLALALRCPAAPGRLGIAESWVERFGPHYRTIVSVNAAGGRAGGEFVLQDDNRRASVDLGQPAATRFGDFLLLGVEHILTGIDHLLFLAALLLAARGLWPILATVTAFTLAHSVTLSLAALDLVDLPTAVVEPLIAASIVWVAAENLYGATPSARRVAVTFLFGLVHGLGFAEVMKELHLQGWRLVAGLGGFNLGVEVGQAIVVLAVAPLLLWTRRQSWGARFRVATSAALVAIGAFWLIERIVVGVA
jgi:hydrogenase/urease accessory protein HupE